MKVIECPQCKTLLHGSDLEDGDSVSSASRCSALKQVLADWDSKPRRDLPVRFAAVIHGTTPADVATELEDMAAALREKGFSDGVGGGRNVTMAWATHFRQNAGGTEAP